MHISFKTPGTIELPDWLAASSLTLEEIGAIVCAASLGSASDIPEMKERMNSPELVNAVMMLCEKKVCAATMEGNNVSISFKLNVVMPPSLCGGSNEEEDSSEG